ncbi:divalent-cation tolerance protein CutA [Dactylosporangium sp. NPDC051485]|uniref:divalent-cation tolerance protein CutA n=1 Tax=Dactylosporangium sp. NPDC051485 TaxID=3154846 RepID=UPI003415BE36
MGSAYRQVTTAIDSLEQAQRLGRAVVEARLAACAQVLGPMSSTYWWRGEVRVTDEWLIVFKTSADRFAELEAFVRTAHPYEVPEVVSVAIDSGSRAYLDWIDVEATGRAGTSGG